MTDAPETAAPDAPPRLIATPAGGVPRLTDTRAGLEACAAALAAGTGPVAIDAERASGIRYGQRAMLVQLKREGAGIWLCLLYTSPSPRDRQKSRMPSSA